MFYSKKLKKIKQINIVFFQKNGFQKVSMKVLIVEKVPKIIKKCFKLKSCC